MRQILSTIVDSFFSMLGYQLRRKPIYLRDTSVDKPNPIHLWDDDEVFSLLAKQIEEQTLVGRQRCFMLYQFAKQASRMDGDFAEIGVYKGGTAKLISKTIQDSKAFHLFDTFSGMPETDTEKDFHKEGDFSDTSLDSVKKYLSGCNNIRFYEGFFPETSGPVADLKFSFVHIDVDIYKSVKDCCEFFYSRMVQGGILIFDDYGMLSCPGTKLAVDEFFENKPEQSCYLPTGQCFIIKL